MSGLLGLVDHTKSISTDIFREMLASMKHRGPDGEGVESFSHDACSILLGHKRLSILDLSSKGHQPMVYEDLAIIHGGKIYNFKEIQQELIENGYEFKSDSDTEVILKAYHCWGVKSIDKFRGMFAFAIYDFHKQEITVFRDRVGVKPLYYFITDTEFIFSSELKPFLKCSAFDKSIDYESVSSYLYFGYIHAPRTIFKAAKKLLPGHYLKFDLVSRNIKLERYWNVKDYYSEIKMKSEDYLNELENIIIESFKLRKVSNVPIGAFLSGGIDSSLVAAILQKNSNTPINTFTIGFEDEKYDESGHAKKIANYLGTNHTERICKKEDALEIIKILPKTFDEPFGDSSAIPTILASKLAKEKVSVVLSGDGGDELFCGYLGYTLMEKRFPFIHKFPFKNLILKIIDLIPIPLVFLNRINEKFYTKFMRFKSVLEHDDIATAFKASSFVFCKEEIKKLTSHNFSIEKESYVETSQLEKMMISDFKGYLPDDLLVKVDRATMSVSLEGREPLLDHKIIEFAAGMKISQKKNKKALKKILKRYIPEELFLRNKQGFGIPINSWLRGDLKYLLDDYLSKERLVKYGFFNPDYVSELLKLFYEKKNDDRKIWTILMFQMWYSENLDIFLSND
ncbi:asparagine synthase (glutamine-hydrolyzing) [Denitrificimonas sp. JX-1]|uniref:asparagine synthase (glutamine-hydrolyzing) n=1 Tax=Denitrificimonas halotolerans TaxID=3098930 RepID=A0ABU5GR07_9GAMM|nr:asparagine synthase (glutamine-hydrolyzing) [Denitrificimonas sp. JX-1]MDY7219413.1 asparagine synthase (glutamine-hydrolyzing) [Denitrificimonas sp. JX-1]